MAFKKCTSGVAWSKCVGLTVYTLLHTCSDLFKPGKTFHTRSNLFPPVPNCSYLFTRVHTCSQLFTTVHICCHHFTTVHTCCRLFTTVYTCSHLFTPVHNTVTIYALCTMAVSRWIFLLRKLLFFDLRCCLVEIAYFCSPNRELSNSARLE